MSITYPTKLACGQNLNGNQNTLILLQASQNSSRRRRLHEPRYSCLIGPFYDKKYFISKNISYAFLTINPMCVALEKSEAEPITHIYKNI